jgi:hypothetical protein
LHGEPISDWLLSEAQYDCAMASRRDTFVRRWRILSMEAWDELDLLGPAFIEFDSRNGGMFQFVAVSGDIDYRVSTDHDEAIIEWSWLGDDDGEETGGRGWARRDGDNLVGHFYLHRGDDSTFVATPEGPRRPARKRTEPDNGRP